MQFHELAVDARLDRNGIVGGHVAQPIQINRDAGARHLRDYYRHWAHGRTPAASAAKASAALATLRAGDGVAGTPNCVPGDTRHDQQENHPDQSAFLRFPGARRGWLVLAGQMCVRQRFSRSCVCRHSNGLWKNGGLPHYDRTGSPSNNRDRRRDAKRAGYGGRATWPCWT